MAHAYVCGERVHVQVSQSEFRVEALKLLPGQGFTKEDVDALFNEVGRQFVKQKPIHLLPAHRACN